MIKTFYKNFVRMYLFMGNTILTKLSLAHDHLFIIFTQPPPLGQDMTQGQFLSRV